MTEQLDKPSELTRADLKRLRESEVYKFNNVSDFKSIRRCFQVAKELVECLRYFDSRASRFTCVPQSKVFYEHKRARLYPDDYFNYRFQDTQITLFRRNVKGETQYFVAVQGPWSPRTFGQPKYIFPTAEYRSFREFLPTPIFAEAKENFMRCVSEFHSAYFDNREMF